MLWVKSLHIVFIASWFAGLFYLPRLYVYHAMARDRDDAPTLDERPSDGATHYAYVAGLDDEGPADLGGGADDDVHVLSSPRRESVRGRRSPRPRGLRLWAPR